jgi:hypothetical protein
MLRGQVTLGRIIWWRSGTLAKAGFMGRYERTR